MATLNAQQTVVTGLNPTYAAADVAGDEFDAGNGVFLHVVNDDVSPHTATVVSTFNAEPGIAPTNVDVTIPAGESRMIGPFSGVFTAKGTMPVSVTYDAVASITVAVIKV
ncbi:MAG: hypothetical protein CMH22_15995 [Methylophaga sp.]|nr:hypothetical protein [Methylophaga sp.]MAX53478.1 hypothetical protein [Methylophaga sp.]|tara:strand:- start:15751 stop:16080 length:330 start_codon:yes stop_codon:yes gene_type:complete